MKLIRIKGAEQGSSVVGVADDALLADGLMLRVWRETYEGDGFAVPEIVSIVSERVFIAGLQELHLPEELRGDPWGSETKFRQVWELACDVFEHIGMTELLGRFVDKVHA